MKRFIRIIASILLGLVLVSIGAVLVIDNVLRSRSDVALNRIREVLSDLDAPQQAPQTSYFAANHPQPCRKQRLNSMP